MEFDSEEQAASADDPAFISANFQTLPGSSGQLETCRIWGTFFELKPKPFTLIVDRAGDFSHHLLPLSSHYKGTDWEVRLPGSCGLPIFSMRANNSGK